MFRGFYTVASGMLAHQRKTEMLSNNLANANTPGYKSDQSAMRAFPEMLLQRMSADQLPTENGLRIPGANSLKTGLNTGVYMQEAIPLYLQGDIRQTNKSTDLALVDQGPGMSLFTVQLPDGGINYTRNGNFSLDHDGNLVTGGGLFVLDEKGEKITLQSEEFTVLANGTITQNNTEVAKLGISYAENPLILKKEGGGIYSIEENNLPQATENASVQQGFLEGSNVDEGRTMTDMLSAYRAFEANQKVLQAYDRSMEKAVNEVGRVN
ncbi:flagellar hook-basal body protein [Bacillus sp. 2205SS5-2]|uniref:flagellar hook-basal body protein n=1 Tax=Bacillus sp. 2205SS5-2 TaxID=3109031 RepID=UPI0030056C1B